MAVQYWEPSPERQMLMTPDLPSVNARVTYAFNRGKDRAWKLNAQGQDAAAIAQRILLSYALGYETRAELAERYSLGETQVQQIILGRAHKLLTAPIRRRLIANGIGQFRMNRSHRRALEIRRALERLGALAVEYLRWPHLYTYDDKEVVANDLYLISGAWQEPQP